MNRLAISALAVALAACHGGSGNADSQPPDYAACTGGPVAGAADTHCAGMALTTVDPTQCMAPLPDLGTVDGGDEGSVYGATMYGTMGMDDDCKYIVSYSVMPICENEGVTFTVKATYAIGGAPVTGAMTRAEVFDDATLLPAPNSNVMTTENSAGTYQIGPVVFNASGQWTVRFHFFEGCNDTPTSPHGHAAFYLNVP